MCASWNKWPESVSKIPSPCGPWTRHKSRPVVPDFSRCVFALWWQDPPPLPGALHLGRTNFEMTWCDEAGGKRHLRRRLWDCCATRLWTPPGLVDFGGTVAPNPAAMSLLCVRGKLRVTSVARYMLETSGDEEGPYELSLIKVKFKVKTTRSLFERLDF